MDMRRLLTNLQRMQQGGNNAQIDTPTADTAETVHISSLALLKMLKHGNLLFWHFSRKNNKLFEFQRLNHFFLPSFHVINTYYFFRFF
jgi:hypothetical protein